MVPITLGILGFAAALGLGIMNGKFLPYHFALGGVSAVSLIGGLAWLRDVAWRDWLVSATYSFFFVLSVALLYLISANRDWRLDLTRDGVHTLSAQTISFLRSMPPDKRVVVQIFAPLKEHPEMARFLDTYRREAIALDFEVLDPDQIVEVQQQRADASVEEGSFFVTVLDRAGEITGRAEGKLRAGENMREHKLTNAIIRAAVDEQRAVYFTIGHGERPMEKGPESLSVLGSAIEQGIGPVRPLRLMQGEIPEDAAAIVIAGASIDFFDFELQLLEQYLEAGGKMFVMLDPVVRKGSSIANLVRFLEKYGVFALEEIIVDPLMVTETNSNFTPLVRWSDHPIALATGRESFLVLNARPITGIPRPADKLTVEAVLGTTDQTWSEPVSDIRSTRRSIPPEDREEIGIRYVAVAAEKPTPEGAHGQLMRLVVIGDSDCFVDRFIEQNEVPGIFAMQSLNWLRERRDLLQVPPRMLRTTPIHLSKTGLYGIIGVYLLLGLAVLGGGCAWTLARRRSR
jgi:hypothetical protein